MKKDRLVTSNNGINYIYSDFLKMFSFAPISQQFETRDIRLNHNHSKKVFFNDHNFFRSDQINFVSEYSVDNIKSNLANMRQLLIEVTDACNLKCKYCSYGDLYTNFDNRECKQQTFSNVKILVDHLVDLWNSSYNISHDKNIHIGFYGGEPLLNMGLIVETIEYLESIQGDNFHFNYNMTTNGVLLNKHLNFIVQHQFSLLISLDGNEFNSSYRLDKRGNASFSRVINNIRLIQSKYPNYFKNKVNFNAVLHNRNSVEDVFSYIKHEFDKVPRIAELKVNGLSDKGKDKLNQMYNSKFDSFNVASHEIKTQIEFQFEDSASIFFHTFIRNFCGNAIDSYVNLFDVEENTPYIPTGTCRPFERKLFLTVNGKILPCEKVGQNHVMATLNDGILDIDYERIIAYYHSLYKKVINKCKSCFMKKTCGQCIFLIEDQNKKFICPGYMQKNKCTEYFANYLFYAESHPYIYESLMNNVVID